MKKLMLRKGITTLLFSLLFLAISLPKLHAQDTLKNLPELSLPILNNKLVIAHCMTHIIRYKGYGYEDGCNSTYYPTTNNASSSIGGYTQVNVMADQYLKDSTLDQSVEFEMRAAKRCGIDGFQFYYPITNTSWDNIIKAYFRVADKKNIDFKFTFAFSHPSGGNEDSKIATYASRVNGIMNSVGKNNSHWLRTPDGRLIIYMWYGEQLATIPSNLAGYPKQFYEARAYRKLANAVGEKFACVYSINENISSATLNAYLDYFPAVWMWTQAYASANLDAMVAAQCATRNRTYTASAFPDFYTSKVLQPGTWNILSVAGAVSAGTGKIERKHMVMGLSQTFRKQLEFAVTKNVPIINIVTWNDYPEGHHLAPEVNHNYGFSVLLQYYKNLWKQQTSPYADRDVAITFFKKYKRTVTPTPYNISSINLGTTTTVNTEDSIEVVTILPSAGQLVVNDSTVNVPAGLNSQRFRSQPGAVNVAIYRGGVKTKSFQTPEWITNNPVRTDRLTYTYDTEYENFHTDIFGKTFPLYSGQYNPNPITVPVRLTQFLATNKNNIAQLKWHTASEINTAYFNVQRSVGNSNAFSTIAKVNTGSAGNSYSLTDNVIGINSNKIYYRLQIVDINGAISYSEIKSIALNKAATLTVSPNPARRTVTVAGSNLKKVRITDTNGRILLTRERIANDSVIMNISKLAAGVYIVLGQDKNENVQSQSLIIND